MEIARNEENTELLTNNEDAAAINFSSTIEELLNLEALEEENLGNNSDNMQGSIEFDVTKITEIKNWNSDYIKTLYEKKGVNLPNKNLSLDQLYNINTTMMNMVYKKVINRFNGIVDHVSGTTLASVFNKRVKKCKEKKIEVTSKMEKEISNNLIGKKINTRETWINFISKRVNNRYDDEVVKIVNTFTKQIKESWKLVELEKKDSKDYFVIEGGKWILTKYVNDQSANKLLGGVVNDGEIREIDFTKCTSENIRNKYGNGVHKFEKDSKGELIMMEGPAEGEKIQIFEGVEITPPSQIQRRAEEQSRTDAYHRERQGLSNEKKRELYNNLPKKLKGELNTEALRNEFFNVTENVLDKAIKTGKENRRVLGNEPVSKVLYTKKNSIIEIHYIDENGNKQNKNYGEDSISSKLFNIIDDNETDLVTYMTGRIQEKWGDYSRRTKHNEVLNSNNKGEKVEEGKKKQIENGLKLLEPYLENMGAKEINIYIEDVIYSIENKENFNTGDIEQITKELSDKIWKKFGGRVSHKTNAGSAYYYGEEQHDSSTAYEKNVRNTINNIINGNTKEQERGIRILGEIFGGITGSSETSYISQEIVNRDIDNIEINDKKYDECFKKISESFGINEGVNIEKQKKNIDELYDVAKKGYTDMLTFLVGNGYLPPEAINNDDKKLENNIKDLIRNLNDMDKYINDFNMTEEDLVQNRRNIKTELEKKGNLSDEERALLLDVTEKLNNSNPIYREILLEITIEQTKQSMRYGGMENMLKVNLLDYLAKKGGGIKGIENSDIYNDVKGYGGGIMNWSDEFREKFWMTAENIAIDVLVLAISGGVAGAAAGALTGLGSKVVTNIPRLKKIQTIIKNMGKIGEIGLQLTGATTQIAIEGSVFHMTNTILANIISGKSLGNIWEGVENAQGYAESIAFFGVLKIFGGILGVGGKALSNSEIGNIMKKTMGKNELAKFSKWLGGVAIEMGLVGGTGAAISLMFGNEIEGLTCESLIHLFGVVIGLRVAKGVETIVIKELKKGQSKDGKDNEYKVEYRYRDGQKKEVWINGRGEEKKVGEERENERTDNNREIEPKAPNNGNEYFQGRSHKFDVTEGQARSNSKMMDNILDNINEQNKNQKLQELRETIRDQYRDATGLELELTDEQLLSVLDAHEQDGILGELTKGQLLQKVKTLTETIKDKNIRRFLLESGFCGKLVDKVESSDPSTMFLNRGGGFMEKNVDRIIPESYLENMDFVFRAGNTDFLIEQSSDGIYKVTNLTENISYDGGPGSKSIVGREGDIQIESWDVYASNQHLLIEIDIDGNVILRDISTNGTQYVFTDKKTGNIIEDNTTQNNNNYRTQAPNDVVNIETRDGQNIRVEENDITRPQDYERSPQNDAELVESRSELDVVEPENDRTRPQDNEVKVEDDVVRTDTPDDIVNEPQQQVADNPERSGVNTEEREMNEVYRSSDVVAVGDLHGEYKALVGNLEYAGIAKEVNGHLEWTGGNTRVIFEGDILADRGTNGLRIIEEIHNLREQAREAGGDIDIIVGNHDDFMISYLTERGGVHEGVEDAILKKPAIDDNGEIIYDENGEVVYEYNLQGKGILELMRDFYDGEKLDIYNKDFYKEFRKIRKDILKKMRKDPRGQLILEEICNMKVVTQIDDVLYCHTNPTEKMLAYLTNGNIQENINTINQKFQGYLRKALLDKGKSPVNTKEFNEIADIFLDTSNRDVKGIEKYDNILKSSGINMICHGHSGGTGSWYGVGMYENNEMNAGLRTKIVDTDHGYGKGGAVDTPHSICIIKKEGGKYKVGDATQYK